MTINRGLAQRRLPAVPRIAFAAALGFAASLAQAQYSNAYFFGDSLTDSGAFTNLVAAFGDATANKFTTNPGNVWSQNLGLRYGLSVTPGYAVDPASAQFAATGGNNYAIGGARATLQPGVFAIPAFAANIVPLAAQITTNLGQTGGRANAGALYAYWGGANDVFFQAGAVAQGLPLANAAANVATAAGDAVTQINQLRSAGASSLIVIALPDMGVNPYAASDPTGATGQLLTAFSGAYNDALRQGLIATGTNGIVYLDPGPVLADILARPAMYGITNTTIPACGAISSLGCGAAQQIPGSATFLFADGVHPSAHVHGILADWVYGVLAAPGQLAALSAIPVGRLGAQWRAVDNRVRDFATSAGARGFYVTGDYAPARIDATAASPSLKGNGKTVGLGYDRALGNSMLGVSLGLADHSYDLGGAGGSIDYEELIVSGYGATRFGAAYLDATLSYASLDYTIQRNVALGPLVTSNSGATSGRQTGIKLGAGYHFGSGNLVHGPVAAISWERVRVDGYTETASPTALTFGGQESKSLRHRLGWQLIGEMPSGWGKLRPYARITHEKEYEDNRGAFSVGVAGSPFTFSTPSRGTKDSWGLLAAGVSIDRKDVNVHLGFTSSFSKSGAREQAFMVTVGAPLN